MKRDLTRFTERTYDVVVIGGGIYGACVAWDATVRGLSVALVERGDFGSATSANTLKIIHGGVRYLQHGDFKRMRESIREQRTLMRIAPHLVHPLPVLIPTYGHGTRGKAVLSLALIVNEMVGFHCDRGDERENQIPGSQAISKREMKQLIPGIPQRGLTGGVIFHDAQVYNSERLLLSFLRSAEKAGAHLANYVEVTGFLKDGDLLIGVRVKDVLTEDRFDIRARTVVNASGPWVDRVLGFLNGHVPSRGALLAKAINLVTRPLFQTYAVGISGKSRYIDRDAVINNKGTRFLFITPWRGHSLIGTAYSIYDKDPDDFKVTEQDIQSFLDEINQAWPSANLKRDEISFVHGGLVPISRVDRDTGCIQLARRYEIFDHRYEGVRGLISVIGVKYTTARHVAEKVVDRVFESWGQKPPKSVSSITPLHGGQIEHFEGFLDAHIRMRPFGLEPEVVRSLVYNYGSAYPEVLRYFDRCDGDRRVTDRLTVLKAEVRHGVREEMAKKLSDVILRRTELGTVGHPGNEALRICADIMRAELEWTLTKTQQESQEVNEIFAFGR